MSVARPCGVYNETYAQELIIVRTPTQWVLLLLGLAFLFTLPLYSSGYILNMMNLIGITVIAVVGLNVVMGLCGQISIGQAAFMCVGAYVTGILVNSWQFSFWVALPCAVLATGLVGILVGLPSLKVKGFYLAMATLAAQVIIPFVISHAWTDVTGGAGGLSVPPIDFAGIALKEQSQMFWVIWIAAIFGLYYAVNLSRSRIGRAFVAIRDNDLAAEVMGINLYRYKLLAFFISALFAGAAGALIAAWMRHITPDQFNLHNSIFYMGMLIVGGMGSNAGALMGVVFLTVLQEFASAIAPQLGALLNISMATMSAALSPAIFGVVILLFLIFEPRGLHNRWEIIKAYYRLNPFSH